MNVSHHVPTSNVALEQCVSCQITVRHANVHQVRMEIPSLVATVSQICAQQRNHAPVRKFVSMADANIDVTMLFAELEQCVMEHPENVYANPTSSAIQITSVCHVSILNPLRVNCM